MRNYAGKKRYYMGDMGKARKSDRVVKATPRMVSNFVAQF